MRFEKWQALGNDYLIVEANELDIELTSAAIRTICTPHLGVGSDGVLLLRPASATTAGSSGAVARLEIYNPDGSRAELSGNGARQALLYLRRRGWTDRDRFEIETDAGPIRAEITGRHTCRVAMGAAATASDGFPAGPPDGLSKLRAGGREWSFRHVAIGNPQCAIGIDSVAALAALDLAEIGPGIEAHELFPNRTNVSFYAPLAPAPAGTSELGDRAPERAGDGRQGAGTGHDGAMQSPPEQIRARIFERGVGETMSSGTGATGAAIAHLLGTGARKGAVVVELDGGELLVEVGEGLEVHLTGWAKPVFAGELSDDLMEECNESQ